MTVIRNVRWRGIEQERQRQERVVLIVTLASVLGAWAVVILAMLLIWQ